MTEKYSITCACGETHKGNNRREVEAAMWIHAIKDHGEMLKAMDGPQLAGLLKGWDQSFDAAEAR